MRRSAVLDPPRSKALVKLDADQCPTCHGPVHAYRVEQPALFRHAGFGATLASTVRWCPCGWWLVADITEVRPCP